MQAATKPEVTLVGWSASQPGYLNHPVSTADKDAYLQPSPCRQESSTSNDSYVTCCPYPPSGSPTPYSSGYVSAAATAAMAQAGYGGSGSGSGSGTGCSFVGWSPYSSLALTATIDCSVGNMNGNNGGGSGSSQRDSGSLRQESSTSTDSYVTCYTHPQSSPLPTCNGGLTSSCAAASATIVELPVCNPTADSGVFASASRTDANIAPTTKTTTTTMTRPSMTSSYGRVWELVSEAPSSSSSGSIAAADRFANSGGGVGGGGGGGENAGEVVQNLKGGLTTTWNRSAPNSRSYDEASRRQQLLMALSSSSSPSSLPRCAWHVTHISFEDIVARPPPTSAPTDEGGGTRHIAPLPAQFALAPPPSLVSSTSPRTQPPSIVAASSSKPPTTTSSPDASSTTTATSPLSVQMISAAGQALKNAFKKQKR